MVDILGQEIPIGIDLTGFIYSTWVWVVLVVFIGFILVVGVGLLLFFRTYSRKIELYESMGGRFMRTAKKRARVITTEKGVELLKPLFSKNYYSASSQKMGRNTYFFAKGSDGYYYNIVLGDLDAKMGMLDIEPIDRDVRMFNVAIGRMAKQTYDKQSLANKILLYGLPVLMIVVFFVGFYIIVGQIAKATKPLAESNLRNQEISESQLAITDRLSLIVARLEGETSGTLDTEVAASGLQPANETGG